ncbi:MAG: DUF3990 domain-containing protein [Treponema sp.]|nr:DUF3990 domain-containing protein [Treponema sp.]
MDRVSDIDLDKSAHGKDFGRGFYTTNQREQAAKFAAVKAKRFNKKVIQPSVFWNKAGRIFSAV